jgi:GalNAc5-diNAcBac-PP-undecaprenol beta-1,3-glucosyltransferase
MSAPPFFSVIVPTHKRAMLLCRALESIRSQVSPVPVEIIVVSDTIDPATDAACAEWLRESDIYVRRNGRPGPSESRNLALTLAKGQTILFLDDDDAWHPRFLEMLYEQPAVRQGLPVYFNCSIVDERRFEDRTETISESNVDLANRLNDDLYVRNQLPNSCFAAPRVLLSELKFDSAMRAYEDWEYLLAAYQLQKPVFVPVMGPRIFKVPAGSENSNRRGSSQQANDFNAVLDYLYVYRRHPAPNDSLKQKRAALLQSCGMSVPLEMM